MCESVCERVCRWLLLPLVLQQRTERTAQQGYSRQTERKKGEEAAGTHEM